MQYEDKGKIVRWKGRNMYSKIIKPGMRERDVVRV